MRFEYWKCDRCGKEILNFQDVKLMTLMKKSQEFCKECAEDFKIWYSQKDTNTKK